MNLGLVPQKCLFRGLIPAVVRRPPPLRSYSFIQGHSMEKHHIIMKTISYDFHESQCLTLFCIGFLNGRELLSLIRNLVLGHIVGQVHYLNSHRESASEVGFRARSLELHSSALDRLSFSSGKVTEKPLNLETCIACLTAAVGKKLNTSQGQTWGNYNLIKESQHDFKKASLCFTIH